jgi:hypothetical protein
LSDCIDEEEEEEEEEKEDANGDDAELWWSGKGRLHNC